MALARFCPQDDKRRALENIENDKKVQEDELAQLKSHKSLLRECKLLGWHLIITLLALTCSLLACLPALCLAAVKEFASLEEQVDAAKRERDAAKQQFTLLKNKLAALKS